MVMKLLKVGKLVIYIPFWLYSNYDKYQASDRQNDIYIPFWLYSNGGVDLKLQFSYEFTFHSGYIQMTK